MPTSAYADDASAADQPDKSAYTLFDPTPPDRLRDMDTDRPNKTNTPHTIDAGHLQVETGLIDDAFSRGGDAHLHALGFGQTNLRLGVTNTVELNSVVAPYARQTTTGTNPSTRVEGFGDMILGGKLNLWGGDGSDGVGATALALQPQVKLPTAATGLGNGHAEFFLGAPFSVALPADFHLGLQTTVSRERKTDNTGFIFGWQNSASIDRVLIGDADVYLEYWTKMTSERHQQSQQTLDIGFTYPLGKSVVLDAGMNFGLTRASVAREWLTGFSVRF